MPILHSELRQVLNRRTPSGDYPITTQGQVRLPAEFLHLGGYAVYAYMTEDGDVLLSRRDYTRGS